MKHVRAVILLSFVLTGCGTSIPATSTATMTVTATMTETATPTQSPTQKKAAETTQSTTRKRSVPSKLTCPGTDAVVRDIAECSSANLGQEPGGKTAAAYDYCSGPDAQPNDPKYRASQQAVRDFAVCLRERGV